MSSSSKRDEAQTKSLELYGRGSTHDVQGVSNYEEMVEWKGLDGNKKSSLWLSGVYTIKKQIQNDIMIEDYEIWY